MPINVYTGLMGSGKSYEVVSAVIVPAITAGRRVVTNVDGIQPDKIYDFVRENLKNDVSHEIGEIVICKNEDIDSPNFFYFGDPEIETIVQPGDMVAVDEAWRFWGTSKKIHENHMIFFREHRHFVCPKNKISSDLVLMVQDISDLHRQLKAVVELTFRTHKLKTLGLNKNYRLDLFEGNRTTIKAKINSFHKKYDPNIFALYSSYSGGKGKEVSIDSRQNLLTPKRILSFLFALLFFLGFGIYYTVSYFKNPNGSIQSSNNVNLTPNILPLTSINQENKNIAPLVKHVIRSYFMTSEGDYYVILQTENGSYVTAKISSIIFERSRTRGYFDNHEIQF